MDRFVSLRLSLIAAPDDQSVFDPAYQAELQHFHRRLLVEHERVGAGLLTSDETDAESGLSGDFLIPLAHINHLVVGGALAAWLQNRPGRQVRARVGKLEATPRSIADLDAFLDQVDHYLRQ